MAKLFVILSGVFCALSLAKPYRYYLNPNQAELVLAQIQFRPRLMGDSWLNVIGDMKDQSYSVQSGDTLWGISARNFESPWYWPKIWASNPELANPHEISPGRELAFYRESEWDSIAEIPVIKLRPNEEGSFSDLDEDSFINVTLSNRYRPNIFILEDGEEVLGKISGAYTERENFLEYDYTYLELEKESFEIGQKLSVVRKLEEVEDPSKPGSPSVGTVVKLIGDVEIVNFGEKFARARVTGAFDIFQRGDVLIGVKETVEWVETTRPPDDIKLTILLGDTYQYDAMITGMLVLLNGGAEQQVEIGQLYRVLDDIDPVLETTDSVDPFYKGEIKIVYTGTTSSVGYITKQSRKLFAGDVLLPFQSFPANPKSLTFEPQVLEFE